MDAILHYISSLLTGLLFDSLTRFLYPLGSLGKVSLKLYVNETCPCYLVSGNRQMKIRTEVTEVIPLDLRSPKVKIRDLTIRQRPMKTSLENRLRILSLFLAIIPRDPVS